MNKKIKLYVFIGPVLMAGAFLVSFILDNDQVLDDKERIFVSSDYKELFNEEKKNIILITIDTLRADHLGYMGYPRNTTPFIDKLAAKGVVFKNMFTTEPITAPAHASILTSLYPEQINIINNSEKLNDRFITLPEYLKEQGYITGAFVSSSRLVGCNLEQGFDIYNKNSDDNKDIMDEGDYEKMSINKNKEFRNAKKTVSRAILWLENKSGSNSFFLWIHLNDPHKKMLSTAPNYKKNKNDKISDIELINFWKKEQGINLALLKGVFNNQDGLLNSNNFLPNKSIVGPYYYGLSVINRYDGAVQYIDEQIKYLYEYIGEKYENQENIWLITSDHGLGLGSHNHYDNLKNVYNEQLLTPLIIHNTKKEDNKIINDVVENIDILPTVADIVEFSLKDDPVPVEGESLMGLINGRGERLKKEAYSIHPTINLVSLQDEEYKYIYNKADKDQNELYSLKIDNKESENIIKDNKLVKIKNIFEEEILKRIMGFNF
jgi:arylsulfatase A-like enzyme